MGLAPSENLGKSVVAKVPVPILSQPSIVKTLLGFVNLSSSHLLFARRLPCF
jgi:hypothetical protein